MSMTHDVLWLRGQLPFGPEAAAPFDLHLKNRKVSVILDRSFDENPSPSEPEFPRLAKWQARGLRPLLQADAAQKTEAI